VALAAEVARGDVHRGMKLAENYLASAPDEYRGDLRDRFLAEIAGHAAAEDPSLIPGLISLIRSDTERAEAYLQIARAVPEKHWQYLQQAAAASKVISDGSGEKSELVSRITGEMLARSPSHALEMSYHIPNDFERLNSLSSIFERVLKDGCDTDALIDLLGTVLQPIYGTDDAGMALGEVLRRFRKHNQLVWTLGPLLDKPRLVGLADWFEAEGDPFSAAMLRIWHAAGTDPDAALNILEDDDWIDASSYSRSWIVRRALSEFSLESWRQNWRKDILFRRAAIDTQDALERYKAVYAEGAGDPERELLFDLVGKMAAHSVSTALEVVEDRSWGDELKPRYRYLKSGALARIAQVEASHDWRHALEIARRIPDRGVRSSALKAISVLLRRNPPSVGEVREAYSTLIAEMEKINDPQYRHWAFEEMIQTMHDYPVVLPDVTAGLIAILGTGSAETYFAMLPRLIRLICRQNKALVPELEAELEQIEKLLAA
jgi:hypothetical protein